MTRCGLSFFLSLVMLVGTFLYADYSTLVLAERWDSFDEQVVFSHALEQLLIKMTGNEHVASISSVYEAVSHASSRVKHFRLDHEDGGAWIEVVFDKSDIDTLVKQLGLRLWPIEHRPKTLMEMQDCSDAFVLHSLLMANMRGLPLKEMLINDVDQHQGYVLRGGCQQGWVLYTNEEERCHQFEDKSKERLIDDLLSYYVEHHGFLWRETLSSHTVWLGSIDNFDQYQQTVAKLESEPMVERAVLEAISQEGFRFRLFYTADVDHSLGVMLANLCSTGLNLLGDDCLMAKEVVV